MAVSSAVSTTESTVVYRVPRGSAGFTIINEHDTALVRIQPFGGACSMSDDEDKGIPLQHDGENSYSVLWPSPSVRDIDVQAMSDTSDVLLTCIVTPPNIY